MKMRSRSPANKPLFVPNKAKLIGLLALSVFISLLGSCDRSDNVENVKPAVEAEGELKRGKVTTHMFLGTGSVHGVYYPIGGVICRLVNRRQALHRIRCSVESTSGSVANLRDLRAAKFDLVVTQSDWQHHAYHGTSTFKDDGPNESLRAVFALEPDPLALMVRKDSEIQQFDELQNRIVSFGYSRSLQHRSMNDYLEVKGLDDDDFKEVRRMSDIRQVTELCAGNLEAILLLASSLTDNLKNMTEGCEFRMIPLEGPEVATSIEKHPYYRTGVIPRGMYLDSEEDINSFGLGAVFVATESTSPKAIYNVVKEIVENFKDFQSLHPSLQTMDKKDLPYAGITTPLHTGAVRYYKEARLLK